MLIPSESTRIGAIVDIFKALAEARNISKAINKIAWLIPDEIVRGYILGDISKALARARIFGGAIEVAWLIKHISKALAEAGNFDGAIKVAKSIPDGEVRGYAFEGITKTLAEAGNFNREEIVRTVRGISKDLIQAGNFLSAFNVAQLIPDELEKRGALSDISKDLTQAEGIDRGLAFNGSIFGELRQQEALRDLSLFLMMLTENISKATQIAQSICYTEVREDTLRQLSYGTIQIGDIPQAIEVAGLIRHESKARAEAFKDISKALGQAGVVARAIMFAMSNPDELKKRESLEDLAKVLTRYINIIAKASEIAELIPESKRIDALSNISKALVKVGNISKATEFAKSIPDKSRMDEALSDISKAQKTFKKGNYSDTPSSDGASK